MSVEVNLNTTTVEIVDSSAMSEVVVTPLQTIVDVDNQSTSIEVFTPTTEIHASTLPKVYAPQGDVTGMTYNAEDYLTNLMIGSSPVTLTYGPSGELESVSNGSTTRNLSYDTEGRLESVIREV